MADTTKLWKEYEAMEVPSWRLIAEAKDAKLAALTRERDALHWQPMGTAPKDDGRLVLLYPSRRWVEDAEPCDCEVGYWCAEVGDWLSEGATADDWTGYTHWMPLPTPPEAGTGGA